VKKEVYIEIKEEVYEQVKETMMPCQEIKIQTTGTIKAADESCKAAWMKSRLFIFHKANQFHNSRFSSLLRTCLKNVTFLFDLRFRRTRSAGTASTNFYG
jgi:hypothetical protein